MNEELRQSVFALLESEIASKVNKRNEHPGMTLWSILVCGVLRLDLNADYARLHELVNRQEPCARYWGIVCMMKTKAMPIKLWWTTLACSRRSFWKN